MNRKIVFFIIFFTIFLDFFNLGLIYPIFSSLVFEGNGEFIPPASSDFYKNFIFGVLIAAFPFGQFIGAPIIGQLSDRWGRRILLICSFLGTTLALLLCSLGVMVFSLTILLVGRFLGGLMAGNVTLAYATLADFSEKEEKVKNFALIPLSTGVGFALGPYLAGIFADPNFHPFAGPALPFLVSVLFSLINFIFIVWKFPETFLKNTEAKPVNGYLKGFKNLKMVFKPSLVRPYLWIFFGMVSANLVFVQFVGPFSISKFNTSVREVGYLYANIGIAVALGHLFLNRGLAGLISSEKALLGSLSLLFLFLINLTFSTHIAILHILTFLVMLACAVAYTNSMALISNHATKDNQGEVMGVAVSVQCCAEFLPAAVLGLITFLSPALPIYTAALLALSSFIILFFELKQFSFARKDIV